VNYLLQLCFDNSNRLSRKNYLFEYKGVRFKLVQNSRIERADHLLTIIQGLDTPDRQLAFVRAAEFLSALGWQNGSRVSLWEAGGAGWPDDWPLSRTRPNIFDFCHIWPIGAIGFDLIRIPHVENEKQRIALALFREANASNSIYLSFLFFWQVLEVAGDSEKPEGFVDKALKRNPQGLRLHQEDVRNLPSGARSLGQHLLDDCRHAIAHFMRNPGKKRIDLDKPEDRIRLAYSVRVIKAFAEYYIREKLALKKELYLVRQHRSDFPFFIEAERSQPYSIAYPSLSMDRVWGRRRRRLTGRQVSNRRPRAAF